MLTDVGAAACPSGDHVWNGHRPASTPNPNISNANTTFWKVSLPIPNTSPVSVACSKSSRLKLVISAHTYIAMRPTHTTHAARYQVKDQLQRPVLLTRASPHPDKQVHRHDGQLVEEEQEEEVKRQEDSVHPAYEGP